MRPARWWSTASPLVNGFYFVTERISNGGTEVINLITEKTRRLAHGFHNFNNYRLRLLLVADGPRPYPTDDALAMLSDEDQVKVARIGVCRVLLPSDHSQVRRTAHHIARNT